MITLRNLHRLFVPAALACLIAACGDDTVYPPPPDTFTFNIEDAAIGTFNAVAPAPMPFSHVFGGTVPMPRVDGRSAAQNM